MLPHKINTDFRILRSVGVNPDLNLNPDLDSDLKSGLDPDFDPDLDPDLNLNPGLNFRLNFRLYFGLNFLADIEHKSYGNQQGGNQDWTSPSNDNNKTCDLAGRGSCENLKVACHLELFLRAVGTPEHTFA